MTNLRKMEINKEEINYIHNLLRDKSDVDKINDIYEVTILNIKNVITPQKWVDTFSIDIYMELLNKRNNKVHCLSITFLDVLMGKSNKIKNDGIQYEMLHYYYDRIKRWFKKINLYKFDRVFIPVYYNVHFAMFEIQIRNRKIIYYDSLPMTEIKSSMTQKWMKGIKRCLIDHAADQKLSKEEKVLYWDTIYGISPRQENGSDCGIFAMLCADFRSDDLPLDYQQKEINFFREKIATDLVRGKLNY